MHLYFSGNTIDVCNATIPAQPAGTVVKYIVSARHSGGGPEIFANSGTCSGCGDCETSSCATVFTYVVGLLWDSDANAGNNDPVTGTGLGGTGSWNNLVTANWYNGTADIQWDNAGFAGNQDVTFYGTAGTVTLGSARSVRSLNFKTGGYTITASIVTDTAGPIVTAAGTTTIASTLAGTAGYSKSGPGTLILNNSANTITGPVTISEGVLDITTSARIGGTGVGSGDVTINGGTFRNDDTTAGGALLTANRGIIIGASGGSVDLPTSTQVLIYTGVISGNGNTLTKTGPGELRVHTGHNTFGKLIVAGGMFTAGTSSSSGFDDSFGAVPGVTTDDAITLQGGTQLRLAGGANVTLDTKRGITLGGAATIRAVAGRTFNIPSSIKGGQNLTLNSTAVSGETGTILLSGPNNAFNNVTVVAGKLSVTSASALADAVGTTEVLAGAELLFDGATTAFTTSEPIKLAGPGAGDGGAITVMNSANIVFSGPITLTGDTTNTVSGTGTVLYNNANAFTSLANQNLGLQGGASSTGGGGAISGIIALGTGGITKLQGGTWTFSGANTYAGPTTILAGNIKAANNTALGTVAGATTVASGAALSVDGSGLSIAEPITSLIGSGISSGGALRNLANNNLWSGAITLGTGGARINSDAGTFTITGGINGAGNLLTVGGAGSTLIDVTGLSGTGTALRKDGAGTLTLAIPNTYDGGTTVSNGTLVVANTTGSATGPGNVAVWSPGILAGSGSIAGALTVNGVLSPGASPGTLSTGDETWNGGGSYLWQVNDAAGTQGADPGYDFLNINGTLTIAATPASKFTINVTSLTLANSAGDAANFDGSQDYTWVIASASGGITGFDAASFNIVTNAFSNAAPINGTFRVAQNGNNIELRYAHSPLITAQPGNQSAECGTGSASFTVGSSGTATLAYQWRKGGIDLVDGGSYSGVNTASLTVNPTAATTGGSYDVVVTNSYGAITSLVASLTVSDTVGPVITCPTNVSVQCLADVPAPSIPSVTVTDACDASPIVVLVGDVTNGVNPMIITRTYAASDSSSNTNTCTQTITVQDTIAPVASCKNISVLLVGGTASITPADVNNGSSDNCALNLVSVDPNTFTLANLGSNNVTLTVSDNAEHTNTCVAIVVVNSASTNHYDVHVGDLATGKPQFSPPHGTGTNSFGYDWDSAAPDTTNGAPVDYGCSSFAASVTQAGATEPDRYRTFRIGLRTLFGRHVTVGDVEKIDYQTRKSTAQTEVDWRISIYTTPQGAGDAGSFYRSRLQATPFNALNLDAPADQWNNWGTGTSSNQFQFKDNRSGFMTEDILWSEIIAGPVTRGVDTWDWTAEEVMMIDITLGANTGGGDATSQLDAVRLRLTDGSLAEINLEGVDSFTTMFVDDDYTGLPHGATVTFPNGAGGALHVIGCDAFATIQGGVDAAPSSGTVNVAPGNYAENVVINKTVAVTGAGSGSSASDTVIVAADPSLPVVLIDDAGGTGTGDRLTLKDLRVTGSTGADGVRIRATSAPRAFYRLYNVASVQNANGAGLQVQGPQNVSDIEVANCKLDNNNFGLVLATSIPLFNGLTVTGGEIKDNSTLGLIVNPLGSDATDASTDYSNISVDGTVFANNGNAIFTGSGHLVFFRFNGNASIKNVTLSGPTWSPIQFRGEGVDANPATWQPSGTILLQNVAIGGSGIRPGLYIQDYSDLSGFALDNVNLSTYVPPDVSGPNGFFAQAMQVRHTGANKLNLGKLTLPSTVTFSGFLPVSGYYALALTATGGAQATCDTVILGATTTQGLEDAVFDGDDTALMAALSIPPGSIGDVAFPALAVTCPGNVTAGCAGPGGRTVTFGAATATGDCTPGTPSCSPPSGSLFAVGTNTVTCSVTDARGITATCTFTVTVLLDTNAPTINCPLAPIIVSADPGQCSRTNVTFSVTATDDCDPNPAIFYNPPSGSTFPIGNTIVTATATDLAGNTNTCTFTVTVKDAEPPVVTCSSNIVVNCVSPAGTPVTFVSTATDNCTNVNVVSTPASGSLFGPGTTVVTSVAFDSAGNSNSCTFTVTVLDTTAPTITCPPAVTIECNQSLNPTNTGMATATDNCDTNPVISYLDNPAVEVTGSSPNGWFFTTADGGVPPNTAASELVNGPAIPPLGTGSAHLAVGTNGNSGAQTRTTNYNGLPLSSLTELRYLAYRAVDGSGGQGVYLVLNIDLDGDGVTDDLLFFEPEYQNGTYNPSLPVQGPLQTGVWQSWNALVGGWWSANNLAGFGPGADVKPLSAYLASFPGARLATTSAGAVRLVAGFGAGAWDNFDGNADQFTIGFNGLSTVYDFDLTLGNACQNTLIVRTWTATDSSTNQASCTQLIRITDTTAPVVTCSTNIVVSNDSGLCGALVSFTLSATDNCDPAPALSSSIASGSFFPVGTTTVTNTATDACGHSSSCTFTITVNDTQAPAITCPTNVTVAPNAGTCTASNVNLGLPSVSDNCGVAAISNNAPALFAAGPTPVIWTAADIHGNLSTCTQVVTVVDTQAPVITCSTNRIVEVTSTTGTPVFFSTIATDNCGSAATFCTMSSGDLFPLGTTTVQCAAYDASLNASVCFFDVTVVDTTPPVINCPTNLTVACNRTNGAAVEFTVGTVDLGDSNVIVTATPPSGSTFPLGTTTVNCTAADHSGNTNYCSFTITVFEGPALLSIRRAGTNVVVSWPQSCSSYVLQETPALNSPIAWVVSTPPVVSNFINQVTLPHGGTNRFFRLGPP